MGTITRGGGGPPTTLEDTVPSSCYFLSFHAETRDNDIWYVGILVETSIRYDSRITRVQSETCHLSPLKSFECKPGRTTRRKKYCLVDDVGSLVLEMHVTDVTFGVKNKI